MSILVVLEQRGGKWNRMSFEALRAGQKIAETRKLPVEAVLCGAGVEALAKEAAAHDVSKVFVIEDPALENYTPDGYTDALAQLIQARHPEIVLFPHTYQVRDFAPKLATRLGTSLIGDVVDLKTENGTVHFVRQLFQGKLNADVQSTRDPQFVSVQAGAFRASEPAGKNAPVEKFLVQLDPARIRSKPEAP